MSPLYKTSPNSEGLPTFTTDSGDIYTAYFLQYPLQDTEGNSHVLYTFDFLCNGSFECAKFTKSHDLKIRGTLISLIDNYFIKHEHAVIVYFCYNEDGYGRHRNITFKKWTKELSGNIDKIFKSFHISGNITYSTMLILGDNPLKELITEAFQQRILDIEKINQ